MKFAWPWGAPTTYSVEGAENYPRISIVTPNYNGARFIEATLRSVICQGYPNLQYIVVDGGSTDDSMAIIERYRDRIDHIICEKDDGHADALNKGFAKADGEILAWLNSDDMYHPWTLFSVGEIFRTFPQVRWIEGTPVYWDPEGRQYPGAHPVPFNQYDFLVGRYEFIQQESTFWRRDLWQQAGGRMNTDFRLMIDGELWSRFFLHAQLYRVTTILGGFRLHETNRSHNRELAEAEMQRAIAWLREHVSDDVRRRADRYALAQALVSRVPTLSARLTFSRWLTMPYFEEMGYETITYEGTEWKIRPLRFRP